LKSFTNGSHPAECGGKSSSVIEPADKRTRSAFSAASTYCTEFHYFHPDVVERDKVDCDVTVLSGMARKAAFCRFSSNVTGRSLKEWK
jgi:hypothetical protein